MTLPLVLLLAGAAPPTPTDDSSLLYLLYFLLLALVAALGGSAFQFYKYRKQASREDDSLVATATQEAVSAAKGMLAEYRVELDRARDDLKELQGKLEAAALRIVGLEKDLAHASEDRERLSRELVEAIEQRAAMTARFEQVQERMRELESIVRGVSVREEAREDRRDRRQTERDDRADQREKDREGGAHDAAHEGAHEGAVEGVAEATGIRQDRRRDDPQPQGEK